MSVLRAGLVCAWLAGATVQAQDLTTDTARALPPLGPAPTAPAPASSPPAQPSPELPASAPPGMRRCLRADGSVVFADRRCELLDAVPDGLPAGEPPAPKVAAPTPSQVVRVRTCARTQGDLLEGVRDALESRDPNRFAEFYHWTEMGSAEGYQLMDRLATFSARTLVDVQLVSSQEREAMDAPARPPSWFPPATPPRAPAAASQAPASTGPSDAPAPPPRREFDLLRVDQLSGEDALETQATWFHLRSNAGCWWLQF